ncbi:MAG: cytochrome b, partial [Wenzhouxiangellaceae bacterium]
QLLHWLVVVGITLQFVWSWRIDEAESIRQQFQLVNQHKSIGMTVLLLVLLRIAWRLFNRPPPLPPWTPAWERRAAAATHWLLYGLILAMPLSGWAWTSSAGYGAEFFGLLDIPGIAPVDERLEEILGGVHEWLSRAILALVALHVLAALRHHFVLKDNVLKRMLPVWK